MQKPKNLQANKGCDPRYAHDFAGRDKVEEIKGTEAPRPLCSASRLEELPDD